MKTAQTKTFYVYTHARPDVVGLQAVFYVGTGIGKRARDFSSNRNRYYKNVVSKYGSKNIKVSIRECDSEHDALELEKTLIGYLTSVGVKLTNMTKGGDGVSGYVYPPEIKAELSRKQREMQNCPKRKQETAERSKQMWQSDEYRTNVLNGVNAYWANQEARDARSELLKVIRADPEMQSRQSEARKGRVWIHLDGTTKWVHPEEAAELVKNSTWQYGRNVVQTRKGTI